jgi:outer membrane protein assembly factor BamB
MRPAPPVRIRRSPPGGLPSGAPINRVYLRRRLTVLAAFTVVVVAGYLLVRAATGSSPAKPGAGSRGHPAAAGSPSPSPTGPQALLLSPAGWELPGPLSRAVALPEGSHLRLFGGLAPNSATSAAITEIDPATGVAAPVGTLAAPVHDAAGAVLGSKDLVFGGGAAAVVAAVQAFGAGGTGAATATAVPEQGGTLPTPRADLAVAVTGNEAVVAGGYDGKAWSPEVLATTDGVTFRQIATLAQPVRYPAVVASGQKVFVIGGELPSGADSTAIQEVNLQAATATVVGQLPAGLSHAAAAALGGRLYVFGGRSGGQVTDTVAQLDPATGSVTPVGHLPVALSDMAAATVGGAVWLLGGENQAGVPVASVAKAALGPAPAAVTAPFDGQMLIADRGNNRLLVVTPGKAVTWSFPSATAPAPAEGFYFPDDAFFARKGTAIITNQEDQNTIIELSYPTGTVIASYGHAGKPGSAPGYLNQPDDAYLLAGGGVTVADAKNCRLVFLTPSFTYAGEIGTDHRCQHDPPVDLGYPNGDTPLADGDFLVSEINGSWIDELRPDGSVVWSTHLAIAYPSDPQQIGPDLYLIADYSEPGGIDEFTRDGTIVWSYQFPSGHAELDHPSLAELLPNGLICANDDYRDRVVCIDPETKQIVWQYGVDDTPGTAPGLLNTPDGFDLLAPDGSTPTHPQTG